MGDDAYSAIGPSHQRNEIVPLEQGFASILRSFCLAAATAPNMLAI
jgi:hypothetical protein